MCLFQTLFPSNCKQHAEYLVEDAEALKYAKAEGKMEESWIHEEAGE